MDEVKVDVEQVGLTGFGMDYVRVPQLLGEGLGHWERQHYARNRQRILCLTYNPKGVPLVKITSEMATFALTLVLLLGLLGLIGFGRTGARAN